MTPEEEYLQNIEEWINENTIGSGEELPPVDAVEETENEKDRSVQSPLQRMRGDTVPQPKIKPIKQTQIIIKILLSIIIIAITLSIFVKTYYAPIQVVGPSMSPTLEDGDLLRTSTKINNMLQKKRRKTHHHKKGNRASGRHDLFQRRQSLYKWKT